MRLRMEASRFEMQPGQTLNLRDGAGARIRVLSGELWTNQQGDPRDPVISAGAQFAIERDRLTLLRAFRHSSLDVHESAGTRVGAGASWTKPLFDLVRYFCELGMKHSDWRDAYRI
jgi:hypothetical protein